MRRAAEANGDIAKRAVIHVDNPTPGDAARVDIFFVTPVDMVVDQRRQQSVRRGDGVKVSVEMQVDVFHGNDLRPPAAGSAAFHPEARPERRLAQTHHGVDADFVETVGEADACGRLALARRGRRDRRHQHQLAVRLVLQRVDVVQRDFRLEMSVRNERVGRNAKAFFRQRQDRVHFRGARNFDVRRAGRRQIVFRHVLSRRLMPIVLRNSFPDYTLI